jgi:hypothetical protein
MSRDAMYDLIDDFGYKAVLDQLILDLSYDEVATFVEDFRRLRYADWVENTTNDGEYNG